MRSTCGACSDTQETIRGISSEPAARTAGVERRITNNHCLAYNCAANCTRHAASRDAPRREMPHRTRIAITGVSIAIDRAAAAGSTTACASLPADQLDPNTAQTPGMDRKAAINFARVGAQKLWAGTVHIHPDAKTGAHHHGPLESVIYVVQGPRAHALGRGARVHRRGRPGRLHLRAAVRAAPGDQRQPRPRRSNACWCAATARRSRSTSTSSRSRSPRRCAGSTRPIRTAEHEHGRARGSRSSTSRSRSPAAARMRRSATRSTWREHCERLGYARFWLSEHHGLPTIVGSAPEILMAAIAARTDAHPHRQRRRHAAALQRAQGGRAVPRARGARARAGSTSASAARRAATCAPRAR